MEGIKQRPEVETYWEHPHTHTHPPPPPLEEDAEIMRMCAKSTFGSIESIDWSPKLYLNRALLLCTVFAQREFQPILWLGLFYLSKRRHFIPQDPSV